MAEGGEPLTGALGLSSDPSRGAAPEEKLPLPAFARSEGPQGWIYFADNLKLLRALPEGCIDLIYIDPPFNTGKVQRRTQLRTIRTSQGDRVGFQGHRYQSIPIGSRSFVDFFDDYLEFLAPRLQEAHRVLAPHGSLYFHIDYREVHYCKVLLDGIFGRENFLNEIIWAYDYGGDRKGAGPPSTTTFSFM